MLNATTSRMIPRETMKNALRCITIVSFYSGALMFFCGLVPFLLLLMAVWLLAFRSPDSSEAREKRESPGVG